MHQNNRININKDAQIIKLTISKAIINFFTNLAYVYEGALGQI